MKILNKEKSQKKVISNLDFKQYSKLMKDISNLVKEAEYKSNPDKLTYSVITDGRKKPDMAIKGWCSRVIEDSGKINEIVFVDYDEILFKLVESELLYIQKEYNLSPFIIITSVERKNLDGDLFGNYLAVSITKKTHKEVGRILDELHCDNSYKTVSLRNKHRSWCLRLSGKGKKNAPTFKCIIGDLEKEYNQDCSNAHLEILQKVYPTMPKIKYTNLDDNHTVYLTNYKSMST